MNDLHARIKKHAVLFYYVLTFAISWGGILIAVGPGGIPGTPADFEQRLPVVLLALLAGPSIAGLVATGLVAGRAGLRELRARLLRWRVGAGWIAVALLSAPLVMAAVPLALAPSFPAFLPGIATTDDPAALLVMGFAAGLLGGVLEELGWTGFVTPRLKSRYGVLTTGLIVGFLWGAWHLLMNVWTSGDLTGALSPARFLHSVIFSVGILPAFRLLMVGVYDRTESVLVAMAMHWSLIASNVILVPAAIEGPVGPIWSLVVAATLWIVVAAWIAARSRQLTRPPLRRHAA